MMILPNQSESVISAFLIAIDEGTLLTGLVIGDGDFREPLESGTPHRGRHNGNIDIFCPLLKGVVIQTEPDLLGG